MVKRKIRLLYVGLVILLSFSGLLPLAEVEPVLADELEWSIVDTPSEEGGIVVSPSEINTFVIGSDGETFYALDIPTWHDDDEDEVVDLNETGRVYKSTDGGVTWVDDLTEALEDAEPPAALPAWDIAVAPDDPELIAVVTDNRQEVYVSEDGGESWEDTDVSSSTGWNSNLLIADIVISAEYGDDNRDIAIGTRNPVSLSNGDIWVIERAEFLATWEAQELDMDVTSIRLSSDYDSDKTIVVVGSDAEKTYLCTGIRDTDENSTDWEEADTSKVEIGESPDKSEIISSDLALPSDYSEDEAESRIVYAAYSSGTDADDVYRIEDTDVYRLDVDDGNKVPIASIAYYGTCSGGKLLVGEVQAEADSATALIHFCSNPEYRSPTWEKPHEPPTGGAISGNANAQLVWSSGGGRAYCGTSSNNVESAADWADMTFGPWSGQAGDESAFSRSDDDGDTWNQLSLIDTGMNSLCDYALSADYETLYLSSSGSFDSLWRSTSASLGETWQRILCLRDKGDIILRPTPEDSPDEVIFFAIVGTNDARYSLDEGETWEQLWDCPSISDLAVVDSEMLYVLDGELVNKGTWDEEMYMGMWEWDTDIDTGLLSGYSLATSGEDFVFVGDEGDEGKIAYSSDGGATFELTEAVPGPGEMWVIPDEEFNSNRFIYAASSGGGIYRWAIEGSTSWKKLNPPHTGFYGLAQKGGALYGACGTELVRTLIPHQETVEEYDWDSLSAGLISGVSFKPGSLKAMSNETIDLWALDDQSYDFTDGEGCLWIYSDTFVLRSPWPTSPAIGELMPCDSCDCQAKIFYFRWRELPSTEKYELWISLDEEFTAIVRQEESITPVDLGNPTWRPGASLIRFTCGNIYYWKVRSCATTEGEDIHSRWSPPMYFTVKICSSIEEMHTAPILKAPQSGSGDAARSPCFSWVGFPNTTKYEFILAKDADLAQVVTKEEVASSAYMYSGKLDWGTRYFWQVKAIEPIPSEPSVISIFTVMPQPTTSTMPVASATPFWVWLIIGILAVLSIVIIAACLVRR